MYKLIYFSLVISSQKKLIFLLIYFMRKYILIQNIYPINFMFIWLMIISLTQKLVEELKCITRLFELKKWIK